MKIFKRFEKNTKDGGFEKACKYLLEHLGYDCEITKDSGDDGVDIIASKEDIVLGVQCKNYDNKVSNDKIRDFNGALAIYGIKNGIFMTTNSFTSEAISTAKKLGNIDLWDYSKIKSESKKLGFDLETLKPVRKRKLNSVVFAHNQETYNQLEKMLDENNEAILVMGTGVGKTTTALEYLIQHNCRALVVCPTNVVQDGWKNNISNADDRLVDTMTYQSFSRVYKDIDYSEYGLIIFDEVHHAGAERWGTGVKYLIENNIKVLGLTATEERTDGNDVSESLFGGHIIEGLDILGGIREGVIYPFKYVSAFYDPEQVCKEAKEKYGERLTVELLGELDLALNNTKDVINIIQKEMPKGNRKGIIFAENIDSMDDAVGFVKNACPNAIIKKLHSSMSLSEQKEVKEWFANTKAGYLCTVGMVNEGAHYGGVNTVFMLRKTSSEIIFLQQLGRCITSVHGHKDPNTVVFDLVNSSRAIMEVKKKFKEAGLVNNIISTDVSSEDYFAITEAIISGDVNGHVDEDGFVEISFEDIEIIKKAVGVELNLDAAPKVKIPQLTRTIYVKKNPTYNADYSNKSRQIIFASYVESITDVLERLHEELDYKYWTDAEDDFLRKNYLILGVKKCAEILGRSPAACHERAQFLGITRDLGWTKEQDDILRKWYPTKGAKFCDELLGRSPGACRTRAQFLGIKCECKGADLQKKVLCVELNKVFDSMSDAGKELNINNSSISQCCRGRLKTAGGYHWRYVDDAEIKSADTSPETTTTADAE